MEERGDIINQSPKTRCVTSIVLVEPAPAAIWRQRVKPGICEVAAGIDVPSAVTLNPMQHYD